jgi:hypothetical protein
MTNLRAILIADNDGVGLGGLWATREAKVILRLAEQHPGVFTRTVCDTLHGVGKLGLGTFFKQKWPAARRCVFPAWPPWSVLREFRPPQTGALCEMSPATAALFAGLARRGRLPGEPLRILVGIGWDYTSGSGEAAFRSVEHFVDGIRTRRIVGGAADKNGRASFLSPEDAKQLADVASVQASEGFETLLLHVADEKSKLKCGFLAGSVTCR